jgi:regulatory protein
MRKKDGENEKKNTKTAQEVAYAYLANRMRTSEEVRRHLKEKGYGESEITETINELIGLRYLDDYLFSMRYYEYNREKKRGSLRAERELLEKGIDKETVRNAKEDFLYEQGVDEYEDALQIARKELYVPSDIYGEAPRKRTVDDRFAAKIARKLESKGFSKGDIFRVLDSIRREAAEGDGEQQ